jgi:hypothetical protein
MLSNLFTRTDFSEKTKLRIRRKATICQMCSILTDCGECAHIVAAGKNGPRNKHQLVLQGIIPENYEVNNEANGLHLCANCHARIDKHPDRYTYRYLIDLKMKMEMELESNSPRHPIEHSEEKPRPSIEHLEEKPRPSIEHLKEKPRLLIKHFEEKTPHGAPRWCRYCGKKFTRKINLSYHIDHKVCQKHE